MVVRSVAVLYLVFPFRKISLELLHISILVLAQGVRFNFVVYIIGKNRTESVGVIASVLAIYDI